MMYEKKICNYGITLDIAEVARFGGEVLVLARNWREKLGAKHCLLDNYLHVVLTALSETINATSSVEAGFDEALSELRGICRCIKELNEAEVQSHPFYPALKSYMDKRSIPKDSLFYEACCVGTFKVFADFATRRFVEEHDNALRLYLDKEGLPEMREALLHSDMGFTAEDIDSLLDRLIHLFIMVSPASIFIQGMVDQVITSLLLRDKPSGDYVFQRLLDKHIDIL